MVHIDFSSSHVGASGGDAIGGDAVEADDVVLVARQLANGGGETLDGDAIPLDEEATVTCQPAETEEAQLRFFAVGASNQQIRCPLCRHTAATYMFHSRGPIGDLCCLLGALSCVYPIFWLSCVYCAVQGSLKTQRQFCSKCGGHLGFHRRPT